MWISWILRSVLATAIASSAMGQTLEVATIKPTSADVQDEWFTIRGRHVMTLGTSLTELVKFAYGLHPSQIEGVQPWMTNDRYDVDALVAGTKALDNDDMRVVCRQLLKERFHLVTRTDSAEVPVFALTLVKDDRRLAKSSKQAGEPVDIYGSHGNLTVRNASMADFAGGLSRGMLSRPVVDKTGLTDRYDFDLHWTQEGTSDPAPGVPPDMVSALPDQIGVRLKATTAKLPVLHIVHAQWPSRD